MLTKQLKKKKKIFIENMCLKVLTVLTSRNISIQYNRED